jgi:hypothetical protein
MKQTGTKQTGTKQTGTKQTGTRQTLTGHSRRCLLAAAGLALLPLPALMAAGPPPPPPPQPMPLPGLDPKSLADFHDGLDDFTEAEDMTTGLGPVARAAIWAFPV